MSYVTLATGAALIALSLPLTAQQRSGPAGPPVATENDNYEAKGDFDFLNSCAVCHGRIERAPDITILQRLSPEKIYETITTGSMKEQAAKLTDEQKRKIAEFLSGRKLGGGESRDADKMPNRCADNSPVRSRSPVPAWNGWSPDPLKNTRYQTSEAAALSPAAVPRLRLNGHSVYPGLIQRMASPRYSMAMSSSGRIPVTCTRSTPKPGACTGRFRLRPVFAARR